VKCSNKTKPKQVRHTLIVGVFPVKVEASCSLKSFAGSSASLRSITPFHR